MAKFQPVLPQKPAIVVGAFMKDKAASGSVQTLANSPTPGLAIDAASGVLAVPPNYPTSSVSFSPRSEVETVLLEQVDAAVVSAERKGIPRLEFIDHMVVRALAGMDPLVREGYASPAEGLNALLNAEGGCVDAAEARFLYRKPDGVSRQTISEKIRSDELIAFRSGADRYFLPVWQFRRQGGLIPGLPDVLKKLRDLLGKDELLPFTFLLQPNGLTEGKTPLQALREGKLGAVLEALEGEIIA